MPHGLQPGDAVRVRGERWRVLHVAPYESCAVIQLTGTDSGNRGVASRFLLPFEPADRLPPTCHRPRIVRPSLLRRAARRALGEATPSWASLRAASTARVALLPYQLEPALAMTRGLGERFLLADEVGLGKTIQAGLLIAELMAREREARVLIVTPAGLRDQWRDELHERFSIEVEVLDAAGLARASVRLPADVNPWTVPQVVITSIDFVKRPDVIRSLEPIIWDLVAFDEAHALAGRSDRASAADLLAQRGRRVVAITATPHSGDTQAFGRLCALGRLHDDDALLLFRRSRRDAGLRSTRTTRLLAVRPTVAEVRLHHALDAYARRVWAHASSASAPSARLAMMVLARRACSSAASLARSVERRMALLQAPAGAHDTQWQLTLFDDLSDDSEPIAELSAPGLRDTVAEMRLLDRVLALAHAAAEHESKLALLGRLLRRAGEPAIVFTEYRDTLERISEVLQQRDAPRLHGGLTAGERAREVKRFTHGDAPLLLATDAASEGLNLHLRCRLLINLEVPWTPLRLEQRIGRIDRLGQHRRVHAISFVARGTAEESVVRSLMARAEEASRAAPFQGGTSANEGHPGVAAVTLRPEAEAEVNRLQMCRALATCPTQPAGIGQRAMVPGPVASLLRRRTCASVYWVLRLMFVDETGGLVWETLAAPASRRAGPAQGPTETFRAWLDDTHVSLAIPLAAAAVASHEAALARLVVALATPVDRLIARERAILHALRLHHARLAAPLVQACLFDSRALREADARRRVVDEAGARGAERLSELYRLSRPMAGERQLVFAVVL